MAKSCKVQLDRLFDHPQLLEKEKTNDNLLGEISEEPGKENLSVAKSCRLSRIPAKLKNYECKLSGHCPGCRAPVNNGDKGVVCEKCKAYWHYDCANVTQKEPDTVWKHSCSTTSIMGHLFFLEGHRKRQKFTNHALLFLQYLSSRIIFFDAVKSIRKLD